MHPHDATLILLGRMAAQDDLVAPVERAYLEMIAELLPPTVPLDALLEQVGQHTIESLVVALERYEQRFIVALAARVIALADDDFDYEEEAVFDDLVARLRITRPDAQIIKRVPPDLTLTELRAFDPRIHDMLRFAAHESPQLTASGARPTLAVSAIGDAWKKH